MAEISFWDNSKIDKVSTSAPLTSMAMQANLLPLATNGYLDGQILTYNNNNNAITYCFTIIAPYVGQSRLTLFCIQQDLDKEFPLEFTSDYLNNGEPCTCVDMDSFDKCLKNIISSPEATQIINNLIAKSRSLVPIEK